MIALRAEAVAVGMEIGTQRKTRSGEWGQAVNPTKPMETVLDEIADERLIDMETQVLNSMGRRKS